MHRLIQLELILLVTTHLSSLVCIIHSCHHRLIDHDIVHSTLIQRRHIIGQVSHCLVHSVHLLWLLVSVDWLLWVCLTCCIQQILVVLARTQIHVTLTFAGNVKEVPLRIHAMSSHTSWHLSHRILLGSSLLGLRHHHILLHLLHLSCPYPLLLLDLLLDEVDRRLRNSFGSILHLWMIDLCHIHSHLELRLLLLGRLLISVTQVVLISLAISKLLLLFGRWYLAPLPSTLRNVCRLNIRW